MESSNIALHFISQFLSQDFARWNEWDLVNEVNCMKPFAKHNLHYHSMESGFVMLQLVYATHHNSPAQDITYFTVPKVAFSGGNSASHEI